MTATAGLLVCVLGTGVGPAAAATVNETIGTGGGTTQSPPADAAVNPNPANSNGGASDPSL
ncbi:hypothetical protein ACXYTP_16140 [Tsukamurella ocularis]|uniref:hypothetical protein n=1 Tax=Tsukamurella ocularis TaxID=1970234 RepID=UPI0039EE06E1